MAALVLGDVCKGWWGEQLAWVRVGKESVLGRTQQRGEGHCAEAHPGASLRPEGVQEGSEGSATTDANRSQQELGARSVVESPSSAGTCLPWATLRTAKGGRAGLLDPLKFFFFFKFLFWCNFRLLEKLQEYYKEILSVLPPGSQILLFYCICFIMLSPFLPFLHFFPTPHPSTHMHVGFFFPFFKTLWEQIVPIMSHSPKYCGVCF